MKNPKVDQVVVAKKDDTNLGIQKGMVGRIKRVVPYDTWDAVHIDFFGQKDASVALTGKEVKLIGTEIVFKTAKELSLRDTLLHFEDYNGDESVVPRRLKIFALEVDEDADGVHVSVSDLSDNDEYDSFPMKWDEEVVIIK